MSSSATAGTQEPSRDRKAEAVIGVAALAVVASCGHSYDLVRSHGEAGWRARLVPLTVNGLIYASSMVIPGCARRTVSVLAPVRRLLGLGSTATLAANVAHGLMGGAVAAWPAVTLVGVGQPRRSGLAHTWRRSPMRACPSNIRLSYLGFCRRPN